MLLNGNQKAISFQSLTLRLCVRKLQANQRGFTLAVVTFSGLFPQPFLTMP